MINYLLAVAFTSALGVILGAIMIRQAKRRAERVYSAAMDELRRLGVEHTSPTADVPASVPSDRVAAE